MTAPRRSPTEVHEVEDNGDLVVLDPDGTRLIVLNPIGAVVYGLVDGNHDVDQLVELVATTLAAPTDQVRRDVIAFLTELAARGLVVWEPAP